MNDGNEADDRQHERPATDVRSLVRARSVGYLRATGDLRHDDSLGVPENRIPSGCERLTPEMLPLVQLIEEEIARIVAAVPGGARNVKDVYPLAPLQAGVLFHYLLEGNGDPYLFSTLFSFDDRARLDRYVDALRAVVARHDILRTSVSWEGLREPVQVVHHRVHVSLEEVEIDPEGGDAAGQLHARFDPRQFRIDLRAAPMLRLYAAQDRARQRWLMLLLRHHLTGDQTTLRLMQEEIEAYLLGRAEGLPEPLPFRTFVGRLAKGAEGDEAYFRELLADVDEPTTPFDLMDTRRDGTRIAEARRAVDGTVARRMEEQARRLGVSTSSICHVAWGLVLARVSGRDDVVFGTVLFGRMQAREAARRVLGMFINTLPVRIRLDEMPANATVQQTHRQLARLLRHEQASLALAQRCSGVPAPAPLFSALLNYRRDFGAAPAAPEQTAAWEGIHILSAEQRTNYPLALSIDHQREGLHLSMQVDSSVDPARLCEYMRRALESVVDALESGSATAVRRLEVLPESERRQLLHGWNATAVDYPREQCIHELFEAQVASTPRATAVECGAARLTYRELNIRANRLAHYLRARGVGPDQRVAICLERGIDMVAALLAVLKAGGAYLPLDPSHPAERLRLMLDDSAPLAVLTQAHLAAAHADAFTGRSVIEIGSAHEAWSDQPETNPERGALTSSHLAYVIYTSGSTGTPKGVAIEHRNTVNLIRWAHQSFSEDVLARTMFSTSLTFDLAVYECFVPLTVGATVTIVRDALDVVRQPVDVTLMNMVPSTANALLRLGAVPKTVRAINLAGEPLSRDLVEHIFATTNVERVCNLYGPSETTTYSTFMPMDRTTWREVHIGRPIANTRVYLLDGRGEPVPVGVTGELYIGGAGVARGYWNRPALTAERFLRDPFVEDGEARMYRTGDIGRWLPDGTIQFLGRNDFQVKIRGFRIELGEIEARLRGCTGVNDAVVVAREDARGEKRLVAYYTSGAGDESGAETFRAQLSATLPEYMVPSAYVRLEAWPLTPSGKLDRKALPESASQAHAARAYEAPVGELETTIAQIWGEVLKVERVGRQDHFFDLGGHSLFAVQAMVRLRDALSVDVPLKELFAQPVLADFARGMTHATRADVPPLACVERRGPLPVSFAQQRVWLLAQMDGVSAAYHVPYGVRLRGALDRTAMRRALNRIVERHEVLRTRFVFVDGAPAQEIAPAEQSRFVLVEHDLRADEAAAETLQRLVAEEAAGPFDLAQGPVIRGRLIRTADAEHVLLMTMHHIASDGWSMRVLRTELGALYDAYARGEGDPLPPLPVQYVDYTVWQRRWIAEEVWQRQAAYWTATLAGAPALIAVPTDRPRPAEQVYAGGSVPLLLDAELTAGVRALSKRHGTTLYMTLLAGWAALLARLSGESDVVIGTPTANRSRVEVEGLIGFFVNTLAIRIDVSGAPTVGELLARVKAQTLAAQQHQDLPFEQVVEILNPVRSRAHSPVFQVMFGWQAAAGGALRLPGLDVHPLDVERPVAAKFDLTLSLWEAEDRITGSLEYATALFERATIERYQEYFRRLLQAMASPEAATIDRLPMLPDAERQQVLHGWNATDEADPNDACIHELFEAQVRRTPKATAVEHAGVQLTYRELNARANQLAHYLRARGAGPDERVAICAERGLELVVGLLGVLKAGAAYVWLDPAHPAERLRFIVDDSAPLALLTQPHLAGLCADAPEMLPVLALESDCPAWRGQPTTNPDRGTLTPNHLAYVIYASRSHPSGVMVDHLNVARLFAAWKPWCGFGVSDVWALLHSSDSDASTWELWGALLSGARVLIGPPGVAGSAEAAYEFICETGMTTLYQQAAELRQLLSAQKSSGQPHRLRHVVVDEALRPGLVRQWFEQNEKYETRLVRSCGRAETAGHGIYGRTDESDAGRSASLSRRVRVPGTRIYILDGAGVPVPVGVSGDVYVGGAMVARGYWRRPEQTVERFRPDPFVERGSARMYRTGERGKWLPDGTIALQRRADSLVRIRGFQVDPGAIAARLEECDGVTAVVVVPRRDGDGETRLVAYYTSALTPGVTPKQLRADSAAALAGYMVPSEYVRVDALPVTPDGEPDTAALLELVGHGSTAAEYEPPEGETEEKVARIWAEVLKVERIGRWDNFFELNGQSLLAVRVVARLREELGVEVALDDLFDQPVLTAFAERIVKLQLEQFHEEDLRTVLKLIREAVS